MPGMSKLRFTPSVSFVRTFSRVTIGISVLVRSLARSIGLVSRDTATTGLVNVKKERLVQSGKVLDFVVQGKDTVASFFLR